MPTAPPSAPTFMNDPLPLPTQRFFHSSVGWYKSSRSQTFTFSFISSVIGYFVFFSYALYSFHFYFLVLFFYISFSYLIFFLKSNTSSRLFAAKISL